MKTRCILVVIILLVVMAYLWNERKEAFESLNTTYERQLYRNIEHITILMRDLVPDTLDSYNNNFTEKELSIFKNSLGNIVHAVDLTRVKLPEIEVFYNQSHSLSESVEKFCTLMFEITEKAEEVDESVFNHLGDIISEYSRELSEKNYKSTSVQNIFEQSSESFNQMNEEIQNSVKLE